MSLLSLQHVSKRFDGLFDGVPLATAGREAKRRIGFLPENNALHTDMLVSEYLDFIARLRELVGPARTCAIDDAVAATQVEAVYHRPIVEIRR